MPWWVPFRPEPPAPIGPGQWLTELSIGFLLLAFIVVRFIVPMLRGLLQERGRAIAETADQVQETLRETETLRNNYRERLEHIEDETERRMDAAVEEAQSLRERILAEAEEHARGIVERGAAEVERERAKVAVRLHREFVDDVVGAAEFAMERSVDERLQERLVADFVVRVRSGA